MLDQKEFLNAKKSLYAKALDEQLKMKRSLPNLGSMTLHEKKMNKSDLHSFKHHDHSINSLVPGVSNVDGVGTLPTN